MTQEPDLSERVRQLEGTVAQLQQQITHLLSVPTAPVPTMPVPSAASTAKPRDFEAHVGTYWLSRIGIVALITGIAFLITYHFGDLGVFARVAVGYLLAAGLAGFGWWLAKRYRVFGQILFGGGLAIAYFVTYALHFVPAVRVIDSKYVALVLLAVVVVGIIAAAQRLQSETVAGIALFLGLHTSILSDTSVLTLVATTLLAAGGLYFLVVNRWVVVPLSSLIAVYSSHITWATRMENAPGVDEPAERLLVSLGFLSLYFILFNFALLARPKGLSKRVTLVFAWVNWLGFIALGSREVWLQDRPQLLSFLAASALALLVAAGIAKVREAGLLLATYLVLGAVTLAFACFEQHQGTMLVLSWTGLAVTVLFGARLLRSQGLRVTGFVVQCAALLASALVADAPWWLSGVLVVGFVASERLSTAGTEGRSKLESVSVMSSIGAAVALMRLVDSVMPSNLTTLAWAMAAFVVMAVGFVVRERSYRLVGLGILTLALGRLFVRDLSELPMDRRILTFILLGVVLLAISFAYTRLRHRLSGWME